ncbi:MAG: hypothetical protein NTW21_38595 [Verrucomicrobia bacterium]|nr:hypothetical protein [Verrucomicrobiota bacterium]
MILINLKTGVLSHRFGERAVFNPRDLDFAAHSGLERTLSLESTNKPSHLTPRIPLPEK